MSGIIILHGLAPVAMSQTADISSFVGNDIIHLNDYVLRIVPRKSTLMPIRAYSMQSLIKDGFLTATYDELVSSRKMIADAPYIALEHINDHDWCELKLHDADTDTYSVIHYSPRYSLEVDLNDQAFRLPALTPTTQKHQLNTTSTIEIKKEVPIRPTESTANDITSKTKLKSISWSDMVEEDKTDTILFSLPDDSLPTVEDDAPTSPFTSIMRQMHSTPTLSESPPTPTGVSLAVIEFETMVMESIKNRMLAASSPDNLVAGSGDYIKMFKMDESGNIVIVTKNFSVPKLKLCIIKTPKSVDPAEGERTVLVTSSKISNHRKLRLLERGMYLRAGDIDLKMAPCANLAEMTSECVEFVSAFCKAYNSVINSNLAIKFPSELS